NPGRCEPVQCLPGFRVDPHHRAVVAGRYPQRFTVERDASATDGLRIQGAQEAPVLMANEVDLARWPGLVVYPQPFRSGLEPIGLRIVTRRIEQVLDLGQPWRHRACRRLSRLDESDGGQ